MKIARVFPTKTSMSPTDPLAFFGPPTLDAIAAEPDEVHISVTFSEIDSIRNEVNMNSEKKILDVTCGSKTIWFNKNHPNTIYADKRTEHITNIWKSGNGVSERTCFVHPDVMCDFTDLPFNDNQFALVVFDPPHLINVGENSWMCKKYGKLDENWPKMLHDGFRECMRVLKPDGVLIFKWSEIHIPANDLWKAIGEKPLFGHHSGKKSQTFWGCFMKLENNQ